MNNPLFRKEIEPHCTYCAHGRQISDTTVLCRRHGAMQPEESCRSFRYDPLLRTPPKPAVLRGHFTADDFKLEEEEE